MSTVTGATLREKFNAVLTNGPMLRADAIIVLCGEDCTPRLQVAHGLFMQSAAPVVVLTGGRDDAPRWTGAARAATELWGLGVAPDRIKLDGESLNTWEQAQAVAGMVREKQWGRILLVASAYHMPRAFLTFLRAMQHAECEYRVQMIPVSVSHVSWNAPPAGMDTPRLSLLSEEYDKIDNYGASGYVATYEEGLEYLAHWEKHQ
jgi:uncharacterized SAM-binding protein YcdF (DUF218 family)